MPHVLIVEDDRAALEALSDLVAAEGFETSTAGSLKEAREVLQDKVPDLVLSDLGLPDGEGTELLADLEGQPGVELVFITGQASVESAVEALRGGASDYLTKPVDLDRLQRLLVQVKRTLALRQEVLQLRSELRSLGRFGEMVGTSPAMQRVYDLIERAAPSAATVFLVGESGTGKELAARALHRLSPRQEFFPLNCGAVSPGLMESELFGHEKGSFTGAAQLHRGYFERAHGGTIFLDEITEMPGELQVKLLRVLESASVRRVGGTREIDTDVRIIAATNRDPVEAIEAGKLRRDLYYRLNVFPIHLPPLADREGDIGLLATLFLDQLNRGQEPARYFAQATLEALATYSWPGNVRELKNVVSRAFLLADEAITPQSLPGELTGREQPRGPNLAVRIGSSLADIERRVILATLDQNEGDKKISAQLLGISLKTLYNRLNAYGAEQQADDDSA